MLKKTTESTKSIDFCRHRHDHLVITWIIVKATVSGESSIKQERKIPLCIFLTFHKKVNRFCRKKEKIIFVGPFFSICLTGLIVEFLESILYGYIIDSEGKTFTGFQFRFKL